MAEEHDPLIRMTDSLGVTNYSYDALNRDSSVLYGSGHQLTYVLDVAGRRTKMTDPDGGLTRYVYDNSDRLTRLTNPQGEVTRKRCLNSIVDEEEEGMNSAQSSSPLLSFSVLS